jgi:hypothetical protein
VLTVLTVLTAWVRPARRSVVISPAVRSGP